MNQSQYAVIILKQCLTDIFLPYLIPIEPDAVYKLADIREKIPTEEKKSLYL